MHLDVVDLRNFYYRSNLGRVAKKAVRDKVEYLWPAKDMSGLTMAGFGFAIPLLRSYMKTAHRVIALMPGQQGAMPWPSGQPNVSILCNETLWPLQAGQVDRVILMHGLETSEHATAVLQECSRVLVSQGRALFIVPNRSGLWARRDATPFGFGRPYTLSQLETQAKQAGFTVERHVTALYTPPTTKRSWLKISNWLEHTGASLPYIAVGGVILLEVVKQTYAPMRPGLAERVRRPLSVLEPSLPEPKPAGKIYTNHKVAGSKTV